MDHEVIGEGSYGCVVYPSLPCKSKAANKKIEPTLNVSKIMLDKDAKEEQKEVQFLESISGIDEYVLGVFNVPYSISQVKLNVAASLHSM